MYYYYIYIYIFFGNYKKNYFMEDYINEIVDEKYQEIKMKIEIDCYALQNT